jgi:hypothetical protein
MGPVIEWQLDGHEQFAEHLKQPELWHFEQRLELHLAEHERLI